MSSENLPDSATSDRENPFAGRRPKPDSFDKPKKGRRVGAHRAGRGAGAGWMRALWIIIATAVLTALGIIFVVIGPENILFPKGTDQAQEATKSTEATVKAKVSAETTVTVLNGTTTEGLGQTVADVITSKKYGTVVFVGDAADQTATISAVFYHDPADEAYAKGLGEKLGGIFYYERAEYESFGTQLVVLIGSDYKAPQGASTPSPSESGANETAPETAE